MKAQECQVFPQPSFLRNKWGELPFQFKIQLFLSIISSITHLTHLYCCLFFWAASPGPPLTPGPLETEPGFVHLCAKLPAVPSVKCVPTMRKGSLRQGKRRRKEDWRTDWLVGTVCYRLCPCASSALHPHDLIHLHSYLDPKSPPSIYWRSLGC